MSIGKAIPDSQLSRHVTQKLAQRSAGSGCRITATVANGYVTVCGTVEHEYQRKPILSSLNSITGIKRVIDQTQVVPKQKRV
jgi:osmotically-inducible protein OsmY